MSKANGSKSRNQEDGYSIPNRPPPLSDILNEKLNESDSETTATNSSDEFDWSEEEEKPPAGLKKLDHARRVRWLWLLFMKLARPLRVLVVGCIGAAIFVTPLLVVNLRFRQNPAKLQIHVWSLWLTIIWSASCITYLLVDSIPSMVVAIVRMFGGQIERLKIQIEVCDTIPTHQKPLTLFYFQLTMAVKAWLKLFLDITWAWIALSVIRAFYHPSGLYWNVINHVMQVCL